MDQVADAIAAHREAHPPDVTRPIRSAKPKFTTGLGITATTRIVTG